MNGRHVFTWRVQVQKENGQVVTEGVRAYWSPAHDTTRDAVALAAKIQVQTRTKAPAAVIGTPELLG